jgi:hypothetical protein
METKVVHCGKYQHDVYIGRPSKWGNPFTEEEHGSRTEVIQKYRHWLLNSPDAKSVRDSLHELKGKTLGCWCKPKACHGDVLASIVDNGLLEYLDD